MTRQDLQEGVAALRAVLAALVTAGGQASSEEASTLRALVGQTVAAAPAATQDLSFATGLKACFDAARAAGASFAGIESVRAVAAAQAATTPTGRRVMQTAVRLALAAQCRIIAVTTFESRRDVDAVANALHTAFGPAEAFAADRRDAATYQALVKLHAAATRDLAERGRRLPRVIAYTFSRGMPALTLAQRLYGDAGRTGELIAENKIVHPLFAPASGEALSV